jgi:hypothetical protein
VGSTLGGIWRVASVSERVLSKRGGRAPRCGRACPALGGLLANAECWLDCLAVLVPAAVGVPVCMPVGLRVLRGLGRGFALGLVGGGLPPRRCAVTVSGGIDRAKALAVAAAASNTARRILGSVVAAAAASAAACRAAASALSAKLCCWTLEFLAGSGPAAAKVLAALAGWPLPLSLVLVLRFTSGALLMTASA